MKLLTRSVFLHHILKLTQWRPHMPVLCQPIQAKQPYREKVQVCNRGVCATIGKGGIKQGPPTRRL